MNDSFLQMAVANAGTHLSKVIQTMIDGVAFPKDSKTYEVFSHEGDELGMLSTADVNFAVHYMKRLGRPVGKLRVHQIDSYTTPPFSFAWIGLHSWA